MSGYYTSANVMKGKMSLFYVANHRNHKITPWHDLLLVDPKTPHFSPLQSPNFLSLGTNDGTMLIHFTIANLWSTIHSTNANLPPIMQSFQKMPLHSHPSPLGHLGYPDHLHNVNRHSFLHHLNSSIFQMPNNAVTTHSIPANHGA